MATQHAAEEVRYQQRMRAAAASCGKKCQDRMATMSEQFVGFLVRGVLMSFEGFLTSFVVFSVIQIKVKLSRLPSTLT